MQNGWTVKNWWDIHASAERCSKSLNNFRYLNRLRDWVRIINAFHIVHLNSNGFWFVSLASGANFDFCWYFINFSRFVQDLLLEWQWYMQMIWRNRPNRSIKSTAFGYENAFGYRKFPPNSRRTLISNILFDKQTKKYWSCSSFFTNHIASIFVDNQCAQLVHETPIHTCQSHDFMKNSNKNQ